ncbi:MAG: class I SAM-dependent methyltransferase [Solirubrobacterales bacterium]
MAFEELKSKQSVMWGSGPYARISDHHVDALEHLLRAVPPSEGERWLDVATGTGEVAVRAAQAGANATGLDLAPDLIEMARERAKDAGVEAAFDVGDAESLPYEDASFDTVSSTFGVMFAPDQATAAGELARVCRPGGRLALLTWHPTEGVAAFFKVMAPYQPKPPEGVGSPFAWGDHEHLEELFGESFELRYEEGDVPLHGESGDEIWELFSTAFGPTKALANSLEDDRREALRRDWVAYFEQFRDGGGVSQPRPYVLVLGERR